MAVRRFIFLRGFGADRPQAMPLACQPLFRDVVMPSHGQGRRARKAGLLDTPMERRAREQPRLLDRLRAALRPGGR